MQRLRLQNQWNDTTKSFDKDKFDIKETDKVIRGKVQVSSKQKDKILSKGISFVVFKSRTDLDTQRVVKSGQPFEAEFTLGINEFIGENGKAESYFQLVINKAIIEGESHYKAKSNGYAPEDDLDNIPF